jgi:hypothetical protein
MSERKTTKRNRFQQAAIDCGITEEQLAFDLRVLLRTGAKVPPEAEAEYREWQRDLRKRRAAQ